MNSYKPGAHSVPNVTLLGNKLAGKPFMTIVGDDVKPYGSSTGRGLHEGH